MNSFELVERDYHRTVVDGTIEQLGLRVIKLSKATYKKAVAMYDKQTSNPDVAKKKADKLGKILKLVDTEYRNMNAVSSKPAKLGSQFIHQVSKNEKLCREIMPAENISHKDSSQVSTFKEVVPDSIDDKTPNVILEFNPDEIRRQVNESFEEAKREEKGPEYSFVDDEEVSEKVLPGSREIKLNFADDIDEEALAPKERSSFLSDSEIVENVKEVKRDVSIAPTSDVEDLMKEVEEEKRQMEAMQQAAAEARQKKQIAAKELKDIQAQALIRAQERQKVLKEAEQSEEHRKQAEDEFARAIADTKAKLMKEKAQIEKERARYEKEREDATNSARDLLEQKADKEYEISTMDAEIPEYRRQTEFNKKQSTELLDKAVKIRSKVGLTNLPSSNKSNFSEVPMDEDTEEMTESSDIDSIFQGSPMFSYKTKKDESKNKAKAA